MTTALTTLPTARIARATAIVKGIVHADDMQAQAQAQHEEDVLHAKEFAHNLLNARRAVDKYRVALQDIVQILKDATSQPVSSAERVITMALIQQRRTTMQEAMASVVTGGVNFQQTITNDILEATKGMDAQSYIN